MADLQVDFPAMARALEQFNTTHQKNNTTRNNMQQTVHSLGTAWTGEASTTFTKAMNTWEAGFAEVQGALSELIEALSDNLTGYQTNEATQTESASGVQSMISTLPTS